MQFYACENVVLVVMPDLVSYCQISSDNARFLGNFGIKCVANFTISYGKYNKLSFDIFCRLVDGISNLCNFISKNIPFAF